MLATIINAAADADLMQRVWRFVRGKARVPSVIADSLPGGIKQGLDDRWREVRHATSAALRRLL
jgi:hypothetical protein